MQKRLVIKIGYVDVALAGHYGPREAAAVVGALVDAQIVDPKGYGAEEIFVVKEGEEVAREFRWVSAERFTVPNSDADLRVQLETANRLRAYAEAQALALTERVKAAEAAAGKRDDR